MQTLIGILIGAAVAAVGYAIYWLVRSVLEVKVALQQAVPALNAAAKTFSLTGGLSIQLAELVAVSRRGISATESNTATVKIFNSLVVRNPEAPPESPEEPGSPPHRPRGGTPPPPPVATEDGYAPEGASGVLSQTEEEMAAIETATTARDLGIETDADLVEMPPPDKVVQL